MKKILLVLFLLFLPFTVLAVAEDTHEVSAEGVGVTEREALTDAFRNAIEESIGLYVDGETKMENEELISDKILTASKGYIHKYRVISVGIENGNTKVKIKALVKTQDVKKSLTGLNISIMSADDMANTHARLASKLMRSQDAEPILQKEFDEFFSDKNVLSYLTINLLGYKFLEDELSQDNTIPFKVFFEIRYNKKNYNQRAKELAQVLVNLGGILMNPIPVHFYRHHFRIEENDRRNLTKPCIGIVKFNEQSVDPPYILDIYSFPIDWKKIYPWKRDNFYSEIEHFQLHDLFVTIQFTNGVNPVYEKSYEFTTCGGITKYVNSSNCDPSYGGRPMNMLKCYFTKNLGNSSSFWRKNTMMKGILPYVEGYKKHRPDASSLTILSGPSLRKLYNGKINVDLLYDIQKVQVKLEIKEK